MQYNWAWNFFKFSPWLQFKKKTTKIKELQKKTRMSIYWSSCKLSTSFLFSNPLWGPQKWKMPLIPAMIENPQIAQHGQPRYQVPTLCFCPMPGGKKSPFSFKPWSIFFFFFELYTCPWPSPRGQHCSLTVRKWCLHTEYSCCSRAQISRKLLIRVYLEWMYDILCLKPGCSSSHGDL